MPNHRVVCPFCKIDVLNRDVGLHILKKHEELLFSDYNRKLLHKDKYLNQPLELLLDDETYFFCLADKSCIKKQEMAIRHFKGKGEKHKEVMIQLRQAYPYDRKEEATAPANKGDINPQRAEAVQTIVWTLLERIRYLESKTSEGGVFDFKTRCVKEKRCLPFSLKEVDLKKKFDPEIEEEEVVQKESEQLPPEEPETPLEVPEQPEEPVGEVKKMTLQDVIKSTLTEKDIQNLSTNIVTGEVVQIPELQSLVSNNLIVQPVEKPVEKQKVKRQPKPVEPVPESVPEPVPEPILPPAPAFMTMTPWQRFRHANPDLTISELLITATQMGIKPDDVSNSGIIQNTKQKRIPKVAAF